jgi:diacylglycerol O-acyltransferase
MLELTQVDKEAVMFIAGETESIYQHVCLLATLDHQQRPDFDFATFRQHCIDRISRIPQFHWKLHSVPLGLDRPYWVEDENFSFNHHIKRIALPAPGDQDTLCEVAANLYCSHLDHTKPLWEIWFIEGLEGGQYAYMQKFHHCMMDGAGALKMIEFLSDFDADPTKTEETVEAISNARAGAVPSYQVQSSRAWQHMAKLPLDAARGAFDMLKPKVLEQLERPRIPWAKRPQVPSTSFNGEISSERGAAFASLSMEEIKSVKNHFKVSLNDVVLALVSSAIREYLLDRSELPDLPLRTNVPVSLRHDSDQQISNKVTTITVTLATNLDDPAARLQEINRESEQAKIKAHSGSMGMVELFQMMPPIMVSTLMESLPNDQAPQMIGANLFVSNIRGPDRPLYVAGARMEKMYPMSIVTAAMGINITCLSYDGHMDFGVVVDSDQVDGYKKIAVGLEKALAEYRALCKPKRTRSGSKKGARSKPKARTRGRSKKKVDA